MMVTIGFNVTYFTRKGDEAVRKAANAVTARPRAIQRYTFLRKTFCLSSTFVKIDSFFIKQISLWKKI